MCGKKKMFAMILNQLQQWHIFSFLCPEVQSFQLSKTKKMSGTRSKIFVVDDDVFYSHLLKKEIESTYQVEVSRFSNAEECIQKLKKGSIPDIIFLDFSLDAYDKYCMNGAHALLDIKNLFPKVKTYLLSGIQNLEMLASYPNISPQGFIPKSDYTLKILKSIINQFYFTQNYSISKT
jgi:two-component system, NtrC family, response regulator AtoC